MTDNTVYTGAADRYDSMCYRRCGRSGLQLPVLSLGGWFNFLEADFVRELLTRAFDLGVTHFDLANNYGEQTQQAVEIMRQLGTPLIANQCNYSLLSRWIEGGTLDTCAENGLGMISFGVLSRGQLTEKHLHDAPGGRPILPELERKLQQPSSRDWSERIEKRRFDS